MREPCSSAIWPMCSFINANVWNQLINVNTEQTVERRVMEVHFVFSFAICVDKNYMLGDGFRQNACKTAV
jgi:hypothetical protein